MVDKVQLGLPAGTGGYLRVGNINLDNLPVLDVDFGGTGLGAHVAETLFDFY
jgi:hypothetical protein